MTLKPASAWGSDFTVVFVVPDGLLLRFVFWWSPRGRHGRPVRPCRLGRTVVVVVFVVVEVPYRQIIIT